MWFCHRNSIVVWCRCLGCYLELITQWGRPRGLKPRPKAARLLGWRIRIPPAAWPSLSSECCVFFYVHVTVHRDMWPCIVTNFLIIKPTRCTNFWNLFWIETLHVSDSSSVHHQELFTVHSAMVYVIQTAFEQQDQDGTAVPSWSCSTAVYKPVWHIPLLSIQWITSDDGQRNCPKHVEFHLQNKFEKLVHLVGFVIRKCCVLSGRSLNDGPIPRPEESYRVCVIGCFQAKQ
jgi:hypothetical protein